MVSLTKEQKERLMEQTHRALDRAEAGMTTRDIMAHIYVEGLDSKTLEQGRMMADAILESVASFDSQYAQAKNDMGAWLDDTLTAMVKGMTPAERCACWLKIAAAVTAANEAMAGGGTIDRSGILNSIEELTVTEEQATQELEKELYEKAKAAIEESNVMPAALAAQSEALESVASGDAAAGLLLDLGSREVDFRAVASMIAYTNVKNGTFENIPVDMKLEQITTLVCAEVEQTRIVAAVEEGKIPLETAKLLLNILGALAIVCLLPAVIGLGVAVVDSLTIGLGAIPVGAVMLLLMLYGMHKAFQWWNRQSERMVESFCVPIRQVCRGTTVFLDYLQERALPDLKERLSAFWKRLRSLFVGDASDASPRTVSEREEAEPSPEPSEEDIVDAVEWVPVV